METQQQSTVNVHVIDEAFYMPQLDRTRRIWVYLPEGYETSEKRYPVIYMHDGQNLFDHSTALSEEWCVDETMTIMRGECIVVGIDNGEEKRMTEYNFRDHEEHGTGEGKKYVQFIVETLKPFIDERYRTLPDRGNTHIAGSSLGGLISFYAAMYFPYAFGGAGIFSPSLWLVPDIVDEIKNIVEQNLDYPQHFYFYGGEKEDENMVKFIEGVAEFLLAYPQYKINIEIHPEGEHSEIYWREKFPAFYRWISKNTLASIT